MLRRDAKVAQRRDIREEGSRGSKAAAQTKRTGCGFDCLNAYLSIPHGRLTLSSTARLQLPRTKPVVALLHPHLGPPEPPMAATRATFARLSRDSRDSRDFRATRAGLARLAGVARGVTRWHGFYGGENMYFPPYTLPRSDSYDTQGQEKCQKSSATDFRGLDRIERPRNENERASYFVI